MDKLKFANRVPRNRGDSSVTVPIAYIEIPKPDPSSAVALVDVASGTIEDSETRGIDIAFTGQTGSVVVSRNTYTNDPSTDTSASFTLEGPEPNTGQYTVQPTLTSPIKVLRVEEDNSGTWSPIISRGVFYRVWEMNSDEGAKSWLTGAGFNDGQYLLLQYTTELDWRLIGGGDAWTGTGSVGGGSLWNIKKPSAYDPTSRRMNITPAGLTGNQEGYRITALGGIKTSQGIELLAENPTYDSSSNLMPPGDRSGTLGSLKVATYSATYSNDTVSVMTQGRIPSGKPRNTGLITSSSLNSSISYSTIISSLGETSVPDSSSVEFTGSIYVTEDDYYTIQTTTNGKVRLYLWNLPVVDKAYGEPNSGLSRDTLFTGYLHAGWHNIRIQWYPETPDNNSSPQFKLQLNGLLTSSNPPTRSQMLSIDADKGIVVLTQGFVAGSDAISPPTLTASYAITSNTIPFRGYFDTSWEGLDLNPSPNRFYDYSGQEVPTNEWIDSSCWVWLIPSMACPLTDASGNAYSSASRAWTSCLSQGINSTLRWGKVDGTLTIASGTSGTSPFGSTSSFGSGILGQSVYSSSGSVTGTNSSYDPRGDYDSGFVIGHLSIYSGLPELSSVKIHDIRVRGGGISEEIDPSSLPTGGARERVNTYYDLSPWEGDQENTAGVALVEFPQAILDGSDGRPAWTTDEVQAMVQASMPAGIRAIIVYV